MNIKRNISKLVSGLLCFSMIFSNVLPAYAADAVITENTFDGEDLSVNERNLEDITVTYKQASSFFVTIPKTIVLDGWKQSTYAVKVSGDIDAEQCVYVAPVDGIADTENIDFYMKDQASENAKDDVVANVTHNKFHWNSAEVTEGYRQDDNLVSAPDLTAGAWRGIFQMEIKLETHVTHTHNYVETITKEPTCTETGEKTYTCDCGDSYTEVIPAKGHHFEDGECTDCGEKDPDYHKHSYTETITKEPTCTETGEKTYTCDCGDSYTEEIAATGHKDTDGDGICDECGENDPNHKHSYTEKITKEPTCTEAGEKTYTCKCGDSYTEVIPAKGHNYVDGECTDCSEKDPNYHEHSYDEGVVTKEPTCTETGEKTFTCSICGHSYTEEVSATGHIYISNVIWKSTNNGSYKFVQNGNKWTSNNKGVKSSTATSTWTVTLANDTEYSFKYKVSSEANYDKLTVKLDSTTIADAISGAGEEITYTTMLTAGTHTLTASYIKDSSGDRNDDCGYIILEDTVNNMVITKEPTCAENGEKTFTCSRCGHSYTEEIPAIGHNYESGKCTNCGEIDPSHVHSYTPYVFTVEPTLVSSVKNNNETTVKAWALNSSNDEYNRYYTSVIHPKIGYRCTNTAIFEMNLPDDYEGEFDYKYGYVCNPNSSTANTSKQYVITMTINGTKVYENYKGSISGAASNNTTIPLKAGKNTFTVKYDGYNVNNSGVYSTSETSTATLTLYKCSLYDGTQYHICNECGKKEEHTFESTVTKEATCVEEGEMTYTCTECGYNYTESIATNGGHHYDENDVCVDCGHTHNYEPYKFAVEPKLVSSKKVSVYPDNTAKYDIWTDTGVKEGYSDFHVKSICIGGSTGAQFNATAEIVLPDDYEGEYNYQYYFTNTIGCNDRGAAARLLLNNNLIHRYSNGQVDSAIGSTNTISTIPLHAGKNTVSLQAHFYNASGSANPDPDRYNWYDVYLENFSLFDGSEYHICNECGKKDEHHYVNGVCVQCGWKEGDHEHHYVNGACDQCGKDATQYNLIIDDARFLNDVDVTSSTQKIRNGDVIELPEKSDDAYNFEGYSIIRAVKSVQLCSQNVAGGHYAINTVTGGPGRFVLYRSPTYEYEFGIKTQWIDDTGEYNSELSDYFWKQTAESDIITIEKPMIYAFTANEDITCSNIYSADCCSSGSIKLEDITRNKTYNLKYGSASDPDGNVKILSTSSHTDSSTSSSTRADKYTRKYMIYLQPGQYRLSASGQSGDGSGFGANSHYWLTFGSPLSASETLAAPVINGVHHTEFGGTLYELIPIEDGQEFDFSTMYSAEGNGNVYLVSNWSAKETE